ncbi:MAG: hypothetical protein L0Y74_04940, partial [candidate division Zixibacteria bacterium]|nr:hypothetical protein [candidate division Zixibacteria bacterium]
MKVKVTNQDGWKRVLEIEVPPEEVQVQLEKAYQKIQKQAKIPGFRPGKVPLDMVKARFKDAAQEESIEEILNSSYRQALEETKLEPVAMPKVSDLNYQPGTSLKYKAEIEIHPQIEAKNYKKLKLTRKIFPVEDKLVDDTLNHLRERNAELVPVEREAK